MNETKRELLITKLVQKDMLNVLEHHRQRVIDALSGRNRSIYEKDLRDSSDADLLKV